MFALNNLRFQMTNALISGFLKQKKYIKKNIETLTTACLPFPKGINVFFSSPHNKNVI